MAERKLYGVFAGTKFGLTTNRKRAEATAKMHGGSIRHVPLRGNNQSWDAPTFHSVSEPLKSRAEERTEAAKYTPRAKQQSGKTYATPHGPSVRKGTTPGGRSYTAERHKGVVSPYMKRTTVTGGGKEHEKFTVRPYQKEPAHTYKREKSANAPGSTSVKKGPTTPLKK